MDQSREELEAAGGPGEDEIYGARLGRRRRAFAAIAIGALAAGLVWVVLEAIDSARNPCQRVRDYICARQPGGAECQGYEGLLRDSTGERSPDVRGEIRNQCLTRINRLKKDEGIDVP